MKSTVGHRYSSFKRRRPKTPRSKDLLIRRLDEKFHGTYVAINVRGMLSMLLQQEAYRYQTTVQSAQAAYLTNFSSNMDTATGHRWSVSLFALGGVGFPWLFLYFDAVSSAGWWPDWVLVLFPLSWALWGTSGPKDWEFYFLFAAMTVLNGLLYAYVGSIAYRTTKLVGRLLKAN